MAYDIVIQGGEVIDPSQGLRGKMDVAIADGKVAAVSTDLLAHEYAQVVDARGKLVVPGLIDLHVHLGAVHGDPQGDPDVIGLEQGVTTLGEGGSLGSGTFQAAREITAGRQTDVKWFLNLATRGLEHVPEIAGEADVDLEGAARLIAEQRDIIGGVKLRAIGTVAMGLGPRAVEMAQRLAKDAGLPLMVHVGACFSELNNPQALAAADDYTRDVLTLLQAGDIVTHVYSPKRGGMLGADGAVMPELLAAVNRGVMLEVAHGRTNFGSPTARKMIEQGIVPDIVSTDASISNLPTVKSTVPSGAHSPWYDENRPRDGVFFLARTMAKMLALGFGLEKVIAMATINPARALGEEGIRGTLAVGAPADVTVIEVVEAPTTFWDGLAGTSVDGKTLLLPRAVVKARDGEAKVTQIGNA